MSFLSHFFQFLKRVLISFKQNQGLLLAGAIAYYTLLSLIPLVTLSIVALSHIIDEQELLDIVQSNLSLLFGTQAHSVAQSFRQGGAKKRTPPFAPRRNAPAQLSPT